MVALDAPRSALATLDPCQLLGLSVKLLDLPLTPRTSRASCAESRERSFVTIHSVRRECTTTRKSFTLQFLGKPLIFMSLPFLKLLFAPIQLIHPLIRLLAPGIVHLTVAL